MSRTRTDLARAALLELRVIAADEDPSAEDDADVKSAYDDKIEEWRDRGLVYWTAEAIPNAIFRTLVQLTANEIGPAYGKLDAEKRDVREVRLLQKLRRHVVKHASGLPVRMEYF